MDKCHWPSHHPDKPHNLGRIPEGNNTIVPTTSNQAHFSLNTTPFNNIKSEKIGVLLTVIQYHLEWGLARFLNIMLICENSKNTTANLEATLRHPFTGMSHPLTEVSTSRISRDDDELKSVLRLGFFLIFNFLLILGYSLPVLTDRYRT